MIVFVALALLGATRAAGGGGRCTEDIECNNGGYCNIPSGTTSGTCVCGDYFYGDYCASSYCDAQVDPRYDRVPGTMPEFVVCNLAGKCLSTGDGDGSYYCACNNGGLEIEGDFCEKVATCTTSDECNGHPCGVDGHCQCGKGFDGPDCSVNSCAGLSDPGLEDISPYCNLQGECVSHSGGPVKWRCNCRTGFSGMTCDTFRCNPGEEPAYRTSGIACKFHSRCVPGGDHCECDPAFPSATGLDCGLDYCGYVISPDDGAVISQCHDRGMCLGVSHPLDPNKTISYCVCWDPNYGGASCDQLSCYADPDACQHGTCEVYDGQTAVCECDENWLGRECNVCPPDYVIVGGQCVHADCVFDDMVCSGHGRCNINGDSAVCECTDNTILLGTNQCVSAACVKDGVTCSSRGRCLDGRCACITGFTGDYCELAACGGIVDRRYIPHPVGNLERYVNCHAGGECVRDMEDGAATWRCECRPGFSGEYCENFECQTSLDCNSHGHCMKSEGFPSVCYCDQGYDGPDCYINACGAYRNSYIEGTVYCNNGGLCNGQSATDGSLGLYCVCDYGFSGETCETFVCSNRPAACLGGSTCERDYYNNEYCKNCPQYYSGRNCGVNNCAVDDDGVPCNGHGTCMRTLSSYFCLCDKGYVGATCESVECAVEGETPLPGAITCHNGGVCMPRRRTEGSNYCLCDGLYNQIDCSGCAPGTEIITEQGEDGLNHEVCVHHSCMDGVTICSGHGTCKRYLTGVDAFECECDEDFVPGSLEGVCVHKNCAHTYAYDGDTITLYCGIVGACAENEETHEWGCQCEENARLSKEGLCFPEVCYTSPSTDVTCNGHGVCMLDALSRGYLCMCFPGYGLEDGSTSNCVSAGGSGLSSGGLAAVIVVPIICVLVVVGVLIWYFLSKKRLVAKYTKMQSDKVGLAEQTQSTF